MASLPSIRTVSSLKSAVSCPTELTSHRQGARHRGAYFSPAARRRGDRMSAQLKRRAFITLLFSAAAWPLAARAQQAAMPVVGYLSGASMTGDAGFQQGLKETGLVEGRHFAIEYPSPPRQPHHLPAIRADVVARRVAVILPVSDSYALAA